MELTLHFLVGILPKMQNSLWLKHEVFINLLYGAKYYAGNSKMYANIAECIWTFLKYPGDNYYINLLIRRLIPGTWNILLWLGKNITCKYTA